MLIFLFCLGFFLFGAFFVVLLFAVVLEIVELLIDFVLERLSDWHGFRLALCVFLGVDLVFDHLKTRLELWVGVAFAVFKRLVENTFEHLFVTVYLELL